PAIIDSNVTVSTQQTITTKISTLSIAVFGALQSGAFNYSTTWTNGTIPFRNCTIIIIANIIVTFRGQMLEINIQTLTNADTFTILS
ncbi:unnamed protein product, partial [Rotaria magnacalcarata]